MLLTDVTKILKVLLGAFQPIASQDALTQRRIGQIGEVIGAVEDVAEDEMEPDSTLAAKRVEEAHDIIHRVAAILAMEEDDGDEADDGFGGEEDDGADYDDDADDAVNADYAFDEDDKADGDADENDEKGSNGETAADSPEGEPLKEVPWDGKLAGETIELAEDEGE